MRIRIVYNNKYKEIEYDKINVIYAQNCGGKTSFLNFLEDGFSGKLTSNFVVDGLSVDKSMFEVTYIDNDYKYMDLFQFKSRSQIYKDFMKDYVDDYDGELKEELMKFNEKIIDLFHNDYLESFTKNLVNNEVSISKEFQKIEDLIPLFFHLNHSKISSSVIREFVIKYLIKYRDTSKINIFIIDDFDLYFDRTYSDSMLEFMNEQENCYFILSTSRTNSIYSILNLDGKCFIDLDVVVPFEKALLYAYLKDQFDQESDSDLNKYYEENERFVIEEDLIAVRKYIEPILPFIFDKILTNQFEYIGNHKYISSILDFIEGLLLFKSPHN